MDLDQSFDKAKHGEISQDAQIPPIFPFDVVVGLIKEVFLFWDFPHQQKGLPDVFVCRSSVAVD